MWLLLLCACLCERAAGLCFVSAAATGATAYGDESMMMTHPEHRAMVAVTAGVVVLPVPGGQQAAQPS